MQNKILTTAIITFILGLVIGGLCIYFITKANTNTTVENPTTENNEMLTMKKKILTL